jgi:hypothetical protein
MRDSPKIKFKNTVRILIQIYYQNDIQVGGSNTTTLL